VPPASADALFRAGKLEEAIDSLGQSLKNHPLDAQARTFLFELLCFAGAHDRAEKHLDVLAGGSREAQMGALLYRAALQAERTRQEMFRTGQYPHTAPPGPAGGTLNGQTFQSLADADPRIGPRLEVFAAGRYLWLPFEHIASIRVAPPKRLRDLLWIPAIVRTGPGFHGLELGEVLVPALTPLAWQHPDSSVRLGRTTEWQESDDGAPVPVGQKLLLVDGEEFPILELRELDFTPSAVSAG